MAFEEFYFMGQRDARKLWRDLNNLGFGDVELHDLLPRFTDCFPRKRAERKSTQATCPSNGNSS
jgi:hypothetical protein